MGTGPVEQQQAAYDAALRESGRNPDNFSIAQPRTVFVASRREKAWDAAEDRRALHDELLREMVRGGERSSGRPGRCRPAPCSANCATPIPQACSANRFIIGTPDDAIEMIEKLPAPHATRCPFSHDNGAARHPIRGNWVAASMKLFAKGVLPARSPQGSCAG